MKKYLVILPLLISSVFVTTAQTNSSTDSLQLLLTQARHDTSRILLLTQLSIKYRFFNPDSAMVLAQQALRLAGSLNFPYGKVRCLNNYGEIMRFRGDFPQSLEVQLQALQLSKSTHNLEGEEASLGDIGTVYNDLEEYRQALNYLFQAKKINERRLDKYAGSRWLATIGNAYEKMNMLDSALFFLQHAENFLIPFPPSNAATLVAIRLGTVHYRLQHADLSLHYFQDAIKSSYITNDIVNRSRAQYRLAELYHSLDKPDSSLHYSRLAFANGNMVFLKSTILDASNLLAKLHKEKNRFDSAFYYQEVAMVINDSLYGREKFRQLQLLTLTQQQQQQQLREKQIQLQRTILISAVAIFLVIALVLWRNIRYQKRTNETLSIKNEQIETQRNTLEEMLIELKSTQSQLIQSEKMASLGELTAGIAHEIQNPLNFVNNFSDVNRELLAEMKDEMDKGNIADAKEIANDVFANEEKINHHGKRADAIVKGMLQHSQSSSGIREPTDLNKLADEYLRLSYHGLRAKDKSFNATMKTDFDKSIGNINIIPQDIGRAILNLINNAFYAVDEKKKSPLPLKGGEVYEPVVTVTTRRLSSPSGHGGKVEISVKDNGKGIPQKVLDKIFQPFFTTKPTGQGTGLGLSLTYDIIKAHGGEIKVDTREARPDDPVGRGEGTEFIIHLPLI